MSKTTGNTREHRLVVCSFLKRNALNHFRPNFSFLIAPDWARALWMLGYHVK